MTTGVTRREAVAGAVGVLAAGSARSQAGSQPIRAAFIGTGNRGGQLIAQALPNQDLKIVALCDVYKPHSAKWAAQIPGAQVYSDFRHVLDRKDVEAVFIATPDHWHALQCIMACDAGKDVYVEKPLSLTIREGRLMVEAARRNSRVVQVGLQRRSSGMYRDLGARVRKGEFGKVTVARAYRLNNMFPAGIGKAPDSEPPSDLDWDMWLGPRPKRAFNVNLAPYKFRWWKAYSSQLANWGVHYFDLLRWMLGEEAPVSVSSHGGRFAVDDSRDIPDTLETVFEFASGRLLVFGQYEASGVPAMAAGEVELRGTQGALYAGSDGWEVVPERGGQFQAPGPRMPAERMKSPDGNIEVAHIRNFLDCVRSRATPNADVEEGHKSTIFAHLGNIALATKSRIEWDAAAERIVGNRRANDLLHYAYRAPWKLG